MTAFKPIKQWQFKGHLGERIDLMAEKRILSDFAQKTIYPETEDAFRLREDDRSHPGAGVWRGEFWGKWVLSAVAAYNYYNQDKRLKTFIAEAVDGMLATQDENGYIGTYYNSTFAAENTWNIWCRKYTLWGLLEAYNILQDEKIVRAACRFCDHLISEFGPNAESIIMTGRFCGLPSTSILTPVVKLFKLTDKPQYLDYAEWIVKQWQEHPSTCPDIVRKGLENQPIHTWFENPYDWAKSYEFISCVEGLLELYRVTENQDYFQAASNIYDQLLAWERSPVGTVSYDDKFIGSRFLKNTVAEICDAVYWIRLSHQLFCLSGEVRYIDEIERTLYNALLCGMSRDGNWGLRRLRLSHEHIPAHKHFLKNHQCCVANLPRGLFQAAESAIVQDGNQIFIGLYNEGKGSLILESGQELTISIEGDFTKKQAVIIKLNLPLPESIILNLRMPFWSNSTTVKIGNENLPEVQAGNWLRISQILNKEVIISVKFSMPIRQEAFDSTRFSQDDPIIAWHEQDWTKKKYILEAGMTGDSTIPKSALTTDDALPHNDASIFFYGPLALSRDSRLEPEEDLFTALNSRHVVSFDFSKSPEDIWLTLQLKMADGSHLKLCDFSSAGNTWNKQSIFNSWIS